MYGLSPVSFKDRGAVDSMNTSTELQVILLTSEDGRCGDVFSEALTFCTEASRLAAIDEEEAGRHQEDRQCRGNDQAAYQRPRQRSIGLTSLP
jgi:hypothetical protein